MTGGAGYIGSHAVLALCDAGWDVVVIDDLSTGFGFLLPSQIPLELGNIGDRDFVQRVIASHRPAAVMHFAGSIIVPESVANPLKYFGNNTLHTHTLLEAVVAANVPHFIFSSTAAVYGIGSTDLVSEASALNPINPYGRSKLMSEQMLADVASAHPLNFCALRYFNVAGADLEARSGQATAGATHLIKVALEAALGQRSHVSVFGTEYDTPDGTGIRDYIHVVDLARAHVLALEALIAEPDRSLTMNCGYGRGFSVLEVLDAVERVSGRKLDRRMAPRRAGDPAMLVCDPARIKTELDWQPRHDDLDTIIASAMRWEERLSRLQAG